MNLQTPSALFDLSSLHGLQRHLEKETKRREQEVRRSESLEFFAAQHLSRKYASKATGAANRSRLALSSRKPQVGHQRLSGAAFTGRNGEAGSRRNQTETGFSLSSDTEGQNI